MIEKEKHLVKKALKGDKDAFTHLVLSCESTLYGTAISMVKNKDDASDCIQDAILDAYTKLDTLREEKYFKTWLVRILMNRCYALIKSRQRYADPEQIAESAAPQQDTDAQMDIQRTLLSLKEKDRLILSLYYMEDLPVKEIAKVMSLSEGAVKLRLMRGRDHFREAYAVKG